MITTSYCAVMRDDKGLKVEFNKMIKCEYCTSLHSILAFERIYTPDDVVQMFKDMLIHTANDQDINIALINVAVDSLK